MSLSKQFADSALYSYDLRCETFTADDALLLGKSFGTELTILNKKNVCVSYDRRPLSKDLYNSFIDGVLSVGVDVFALGQVGTPVVQYMAVDKKLDSAVSITASHNADTYHGFKFFIGNSSFFGESLKSLVLRCLERKFDDFERGSLFQIRYPSYIRKLSSIDIKGKFKVGWDMLNGCGGDIFHKLHLKGNHIVLNADIKDRFGGLAPDPSCFARLEEILSLEKSSKVDFAFLIDGDADRVSLLYKGEVILGDVFLAMLIYLEHLLSNRKAHVVWDDISSLSIKKWAARFSEGFFSMTGHSHVQKLALEKDCFVAGELSGHYMFKDMFYINDGIYSSLKFISYLERSGLLLDDLLNIVPKVFVKKCSNIPCSDFIEKQKKIDSLKCYLKSSDIQFAEFDGIKVFLDFGYLIIRPSNTEPLIRVLAEGYSADGLDSVLSFVDRLVKIV